MNARGERIHGCGMFWRNISCIFQRSSHVVNLDALSLVFSCVFKKCFVQGSKKKKRTVMRLGCDLCSSLLNLLSQLSMNINEN